MKRTIFFFVKVFEKKEYAEYLLNGSLHVNRLSYFRKVEDDQEANRRDEYEAVVAWHQPDQVKIVIDAFAVNPKDFAGPASIQMNYHGNLNVYCVYAGHSGEFETVTKETMSEFKRQLEIPDDRLKLGCYAVIIINVTEFIQRVIKSAKHYGYGMSAKLVDYYDPNEFSGFIDENEAIFKKRKDYQDQSEYRFAINTGLAGNDAITLEIGNIRDIAQICNVEDINSGIELSLPQQESE